MSLLGRGTRWESSSSPNVVRRMKVQQQMQFRLGVTTSTYGYNVCSTKSQLQASQLQQNSSLFWTLTFFISSTSASYRLTVWKKTLTAVPAVTSIPNQMSPNGSKKNVKCINIHIDSSLRYILSVNYLGDTRRGRTIYGTSGAVGIAVTAGSRYNYNHKRFRTNEREPQSAED